MAKKRAKVVGGREIGSCTSSVKPAEMDLIELEDLEEELNMTSIARIGREAPDFQLSAYHKGEFTTVKLSDYRGKWVQLCFYPGDFTFV